LPHPILPEAVSYSLNNNENEIKYAFLAKGEE
jgi:hypothetical protein